MYLPSIVHHPLAVLFIVLIGLVAGSFINCWAYRRIHGGSVWSGRSQCPYCEHVLQPLELIPVLSWLIQGGRCRHCGHAIGARYPLSEIICALALWGVAWRATALSSDALWVAETIELAIFVCILLYVSLTDLDDLFIPNGALVVALVVRACYLLVCWALAAENVLDQLLGSLLGGLILGGGLLLIVLVADKVLGRDSMGGGDIKLLFVVGCYLGWQLGLACLLLACIVGIVAALIAQHGANAHQSQDSEPSDESEAQSFFGTTMPFGPAIALSCWIMIVWGPQILSAYLALFQ